MCKPTGGQRTICRHPGDGLIDKAEDLLITIMAVQQNTGGSVNVQIEVDSSEIIAYGCAGITAIDGDYVGVNSLVEQWVVGGQGSGLHGVVRRTAVTMPVTR